jgi:chemotaxis protein methyltransferase CheR
MNATEADWKLLTDLLVERFGLAFSGTRREILAGRLQARLDALHLDGVREYYHFLRFHPAREEELGELSRRITNNETYFFREVAQLDAIAEAVVPQLDRRGRPVRILSAGCSSGEEPYSLAIRLTDAALELSGRPWEIDACDLNPSRVEQARAATYEEGSFRACDAETRRRCFVEENGRYRLRDRYRRGVRFFQANLAGPFAGAGWGEYDVVLCRNLLIYFAPEAFDCLIARFARLIPSGGFLFLGHSESLFDRSDDFELAHIRGAMGYRRKAGAG